MRIADRLIARVTRRAPDFIVGGRERPYLRRWWLTPWRRLELSPRPWVRALGSMLPNAYLHEFLRDDDDSALHDHPWSNASLLLRGCYVEHTIAAGGVHRRAVRVAGALVIRWSGRQAHRIELQDGVPCWTLFITGPRYREWGFHCPEQGWIHWRRFVAADDAGAVGRGCDA